MDSFGSIHAVDFDNKEQLKRLEELNGELIPIPKEEFEDVAAMNRAARRDWFKKNKTTHRPTDEDE